MNNVYIEGKYPLSFREEDAKELGEHLRLRHSVELVGAKRVGIGNFLRFFLYREGVVEKYINHGESHLFVPVDLNDLVEIDLFAFWVLSFKRLADVAENSNISAEVKKKISDLFLDSIQSKDAFLTIESLRQALLELIRSDILPTIFFLHFDRLEPVVNRDFFANLVGLQTASANKLAYVFTSFRTLDEISPSVFSRKLLSVFSHPIYMEPAQEKDTKVIFETYEQKYNVKPSAEVEQEILKLSGGHVQYLQLSLIILNQRVKGQSIGTDELFEILVSDERISLQSEEIWESLTVAEKSVLEKAFRGVGVSREEKEGAAYLWKTGILSGDGKESKIFSVLFEDYLKRRSRVSAPVEKTDLTKKEKLMFEFLLANRDEVCERDSIIEHVWPEEAQELGVSDWTVDRLVARLRTKLKKQKSEYEIVTVKTRGFKLT
ncbi:MAG: helix-turn-helix domain-containing protein [Candidatus Curtissbacteria bacterium]|nr:helix-turn-helix domain-containing protein [Candidatus Curtissbacteria bacterium]